MVSSPTGSSRGIFKSKQPSSASVVCTPSLDDFVGLCLSTSETVSNIRSFPYAYDRADQLIGRPQPTVLARLLRRRSRSIDKHTWVSCGQIWVKQSVGQQPAYCPPIAFQTLSRFQWHSCLLPKSLRHYTSTWPDHNAPPSAQTQIISYWLRRGHVRHRARPPLRIMELYAP